MKLESWHSTDDKRRWKIVRTDDYSDVPCLSIVEACEATGECVVVVAKPDGGSDTKNLSFGPRGIRLCGRGRR